MHYKYKYILYIYNTNYDIYYIIYYTSTKVKLKEAMKRFPIVKNTKCRNSVIFG